MSAPALAFVELEDGLEAALERVPAAAGVGQLVAADGRNLILGTASNLRRWAASHLGLAAKPLAGRRPKTNLAGIAAGVAFVETRGAFHQRLVYERLMAPLVPISARRDLRPPAFVQLDLGERFPRAVVTGEVASAFGPFRDRRAAEKARDVLQRQFRLRPCDARFEPAPDLPLGVSCLYAQVRSCAAPCLVRVGEPEYRSLAASASAWLASPETRAEAPAAVPATIASAGARALIVDAGRGEVGLFPIAGGRVLGERARWTSIDGLERELGTLDWSAPQGGDAEAQPLPGAGDWPWLVSWLRARKARAAYLVLSEGESPVALAARAAAVVSARPTAPRAR